MCLIEQGWKSPNNKATQCQHDPMKCPKIRERIRSIAFDLLGQHPQGLRYSALLRKIKQADPELKTEVLLLLQVERIKNVTAVSAR
jgi:hypothetical protein